MSFFRHRMAPLIGGLFFLIACGGPASIPGSGGIATIGSERVIADTELLAEVAREFYRHHPDAYDMLVLWGGPEFAPGHAYYWPVKNDVRGIGYSRDGVELFDDSAAFGSANLQGIIWIGPDWITNADEGQGPRSVLGILAQETGHRWAATMRFREEVSGADSSSLLEDSCHWSRYLDAGASPMGGNQWDPLGGSLYQSLPVDRVEYCDLDLYAMGLISAGEVGPVRLLVNARSPDAEGGEASSKAISKLLEPVTVRAEVREVAIEQIIEALGERDPDAGFSAKRIRQAWIYVYQEPEPLVHSGLERLVGFQHQWGDFFSRATGGRSMMDSSLR